jgi:hypothetical protein
MEPTHWASIAAVAAAGLVWLLSSRVRSDGLPPRPNPGEGTGVREPRKPRPLVRAAADAKPIISDEAD